MAIEVQMPDGSFQQFPSLEKIVESPIVGGSPQTVEQPVAHPDWLFRPHLDGWRAVQRRR